MFCCTNEIASVTVWLFSLFELQYLFLSFQFKFQGSLQGVVNSIQIPHEWTSVLLNLPNPSSDVTITATGHAKCAEWNASIL